MVFKYISDSSHNTLKLKPSIARFLHLMQTTCGWTPLSTSSSFILKIVQNSIKFAISVIGTELVICPYVNVSCSSIYQNIITVQGGFRMEFPADMTQLIQIDKTRDRYPCCIVWTPIPLLTWLFPFIGHMGIGLSSGVIRDFAGPYHVSEDSMAFGRPTKYWQLNPSLARGDVSGWDRAVTEASDIYKGRMHNLFCDNCHSHVATALDLMHYDGTTNWNMVKLAFFILIYGKYVNFWCFLKTWLPFLMIISLIIFFSLYARFL